MYTIKKAAAMLGAPETTVKRWMKQCGIEGKMVKTDRKRLYITHNDMNLLIDHLDKKVAKIEANKRKQKGNNAEVTENSDSRHYQVNAEGSFYSLSSVAAILDVSVETVRAWSPATARVNTPQIGGESVGTGLAPLTPTHSPENAQTNGAYSVVGTGLVPVRKRVADLPLPVW